MFFDFAIYPKIKKGNPYRMCNINWCPILLKLCTIKGNQNIASSRNLKSLTQKNKKLGQQCSFQKV